MNHLASETDAEGRITTYVRDEVYRVKAIHAAVGTPESTTAQFTYDKVCLLYTSDAADERSSVDLGGRRIIKQKTQQKKNKKRINKKIVDIKGHTAVT